MATSKSATKIPRSALAAGIRPSKIPVTWKQPFWALAKGNEANQVIARKYGDLETSGDKTTSKELPDYSEKKDVWVIDADMARDLLDRQARGEWSGKIYTQRSPNLGVSRYQNPKGAVTRKNRRAKDKLAKTSISRTQTKA